MKKDGITENCVIEEITEKKKQFLDLLLLADEQEDMIDRYLERGRMYILRDGDVKAVCVVTEEGEGMLEVKNMAVNPDSQRMGYGRELLRYIEEVYRGSFHTIQVGTGDSPMTIPFYERCGFIRTHRVPNFFTEHYDHPIFEQGVMLKDMIYLQKKLK